LKNQPNPVKLPAEFEEAFNVGGSDKQKHSDIEQAKRDILRAHDILPPYDKLAQQPAQRKHIEPADDEKPQNNPPQTEKHDIPTFDLAEKILAQQRKTASFKRKSPIGEEKLAPAEQVKPAIPVISIKLRQPATKTTYKPAADLSDSLIAEIVARDIERLRAFGR
jgi:hypothetical protein